MKLISICIPTHEMNGKGHKFLRQSFDILSKQTFKDFNVVISDHSSNKEIENLCDEYREKFEIIYLKNKENIGCSSPNINNAIKHANGKLIKIIFMDDFLFEETSLEKIVKNFNLKTDHWMITGCTHTKDGKNFYRNFYPKYHKRIYLGKNTISSPSVLTIKNENPLLFDEKLVWLMDVDYYTRCYNKFGPPRILHEIGIVNRISEIQVSKITSIKRKEDEYKYILEKFESGFWYKFHMITRFIRYIKYISLFNFLKK